MRILIACEFSGRIRDAFIARGHDAVSCDLLESEAPGPHIQGDVLDILDDGWDAMIAHPPCTDLARSGARWWRKKGEETQLEAIHFVWKLWRADIPKIAIENPIGILPRYIGKATQIVHPWWFGDPESKATCLWLKGLPPLTKTNEITYGIKTSVYSHSQNPERPKNRSRTPLGMAAAMAEKWG